MSIETFTKEQFESYLSQSHSPFESLGLVDGEYSYRLPLDGQSAIMLRSSIKSDGQSAATGKDSIRAWLVGNNDKPLGSKITKWTTRKAGWEGRTTNNIKLLLELRTLAGDCKECGKPRKIFKSKQENSKGRFFAKCLDHNRFQWLDNFTKEELNNVYFSKQSHSNGNIGNVEAVARPERRIEQDAVQPGDTDNGNSGDQEREIEPVHSASVSGVFTPNPEQELAINAPIDANIRVLAPPGSGKTKVIEHRYKFLVDNGVSPDKILVVTFSKSMADEMGQRIQATCLRANLEQISTIHAFCFRLLTRWDVSSPFFKWQVPKDWQVRRELEDIIGHIWSYGEKPGYSEVLNYIETSKYLGLTTEDAYQWFTDVLGQQYGEWLYEIRSRFDAWLNRNRSLTFTDMVYQVEQRLRRDSAWRKELQSKWNYVITDEGQDVNYQAMRILITISLEPGQNTVYEVR